MKQNIKKQKVKHMVYNGHCCPLMMRQQVTRTIKNKKISKFQNSNFLFTLNIKIRDKHTCIHTCDDVQYIHIYIHAICMHVYIHTNTHTCIPTHYIQHTHCTYTYIHMYIMLYIMFVVLYMYCICIL